MMSAGSGGFSFAMGSVYQRKELWTGACEFLLSLDIHCGENSHKGFSNAIIANAEESCKKEEIKAQC